MRYHLKIQKSFPIFQMSRFIKDELIIYNNTNLQRLEILK